MPALLPPTLPFFAKLDSDAINGARETEGGFVGVAHRQAAVAAACQSGLHRAYRPGPQDLDRADGRAPSMKSLPDRHRRARIVNS